MTKTIVMRKGVPEVATLEQDDKTQRYCVTAEDGTYGEGDTVMEAVDAVSFQLAKRVRMFEGGAK